MLDFDIQRCTRRCAKSDREFQPGEVVYSVLIVEGGKTVRYDYAKDVWESPPEGAVGYWKTTIPEPNSNKVNWAPNDVMLDYFIQLEEDKTKLEVRYVLALLLVRRRILRLEETTFDEQGLEWMVLNCPRDEQDYQVQVASPDAKQVGAIQDELAALLYGDAAT